MNKNDLKYTDDLLFMVKYEKNMMHNILLYVIALAIILFVIFISYAQIDERVKGEGKIVPKTRVVNIQSLEGGVIDSVYKLEGDVVKKGDALVKLNPIRDISNNEDTGIQLESNRANKIRLGAEIDYDMDANITLIWEGNLSKYGTLQYDIFQERVLNLHHKIEVLEYQKEQKVSQIKNLGMKIVQLKHSKKLLNQELLIKKELHRAKALSLDMIYKLQRELNTMLSQIESYEENRIEATSAIGEIESKKAEYLSQFRMRATEELGKVEGYIERLESKLRAEKDKLYRTVLRSSVNGIIKNIYFSHNNEVIRSAEVIMDILPTDDRLLIETKITPQDIAFIAIDQQAIVNITAYDFSVYGGLNGKIIEIGVDSIFDKMTNKYYYSVKILTSSNYLFGKHGEKLNIMPGMIAEVNIITGKKSIFDFIFKPILKTYKNALHER